MKYTRQEYVRFLCTELEAQEKSYEQIVKTKATVLKDNGEVFVGMFQRINEAGLSFSTENLDIEERIDAFCTTLHYFKELHFDFSSFNIAENAESIKNIFKKNEGTQNTNTEGDL